MTGVTVVYFLPMFYVTGRLHPSPMVRDHQQVAAVEGVFGLAAYIVLVGGKTPPLICLAHAFRVCHILGDTQCRRFLNSIFLDPQSFGPLIEPVNGRPLFQSTQNVAEWKLPALLFMRQETVDPW